jgi:membrane AbrB-like protein
VWKVTGIEPALSAWESKACIREPLEAESGASLSNLDSPSRMVHRSFTDRSPTRGRAVDVNGDASHTVRLVGQILLGTVRRVSRMPRHPNLLRSILTWLLLACLTWFTGSYAARHGLPAAHLLVAVLWGLVATSTGLVRGSVPSKVHTAAQAVSGVVVGAFLDVQALAAAGPALLPLLGITAATVVISLGAGWLLARQTGLDLATASLGLVAGGSAAIVGVAEDLDADSRLVAFMQYLRLILIVLTTPLLVTFVFSPGSAHVPTHNQPGLGVPWAAAAAGYMFLLWAAPMGMVLGKVLRLPAPAFIGPVLAAAVATVVGIGHQPPVSAREMAFTVIGLEVGLRLNLSSLRTMGRMLPAVLSYVVGITAACSVMAYLVTLAAPITPLNAFLATTPGGINAVLAEASSVADSNIALISTVQTMRLFAMVLIVPPLLRWLVSRSIARQALQGPGRSRSNEATPDKVHPVSAQGLGAVRKVAAPPRLPRPQHLTASRPSPSSTQLRPSSSWAKPRNVAMVSSGGFAKVNVRPGLDPRHALCRVPSNSGALIPREFTRTARAPRQRPRHTTAQGAWASVESWRNPNP